MVSGAGARAARELLQRRLESQWIAPPRAGTGSMGTGTGTGTSSGAGESTGTGAGTGSDPDRTVAGAVRQLLAVQAQDFGQGVWALGVRAPGSTRADVNDALDRAEVVRSWPMRGTLHFTTPDDLRWMLSLTARRTVSSTAARQRQLGIDDAVIDRAREVATSELRGGAALSRDEFFALLESARVETTAQRGVHLIWLLAHEGLVCWGPTRGTQQALVLLDEWAPPRWQPSRDDSLAEFVLRYFTGHGPATLKDFCWWSKTSVADAKRGLELARDRLDEVRIGETDYWVASPTPSAPTSTATTATDAAPSRRGRPDVYALPGFDEYLLGYQSRSPAVAPEFADRVVPGNNGIFLPMIVSRAEIVGTWKRSVTTTKATVTVEPFTTLTAAEHAALEREVHRYGDFLGMAATLTAAGPDGAHTRAATSSTPTAATSIDAGGDAVESTASGDRTTAAPGVAPDDAPKTTTTDGPTGAARKAAVGGTRAAKSSATGGGSARKASR
ncbi:winged helix DNA-binding domain-containing protein [Herbiconiux daphne]|uniref:Winged helix DNA-binding domain-containing protein n=1 Tax=Herbiconiux daphne TaxID=2970914 RepID=A0ABT2GWN7_9MICO|nr:crosslink repair DNA glycosylase YcaQ family protein [Herbiconiux daphne]MCS5732328.1 winged helix DNA-binding domain-containing protein [Herbiconiux daphne]